MLPENHACNARNIQPGTIFVEAEHKDNLYCDDIEIDYKAGDQTFDTILNLIRGRYTKYYPNSKRLLSNEKSRIFIYMNGHGGENFFKIQDTEVVHSEDFAKVFREMHIKGLYSEILLILDSCEAMSLFDQVDAPNILMVGSSLHHQHAYSHQEDHRLNLFLNDKFTYYFYEFLYNGQFTRNIRISDFVSLFPFSKLDSDLGIKNTHQNKNADQIYLYEYLPIDKDDVIYGKGIDKNQDGIQYYDYNDYNVTNLIF